ncbi:P-loop containing nucleoside triphosphate hydrolase protein [Achaetomium macrosporum]|uniref:P-loop containing nucleoside triphosphate hydrolase protein n=1 Tax=Achaetomium macrosporum TaxID=79813 RepID=A0AAN7HCL1_9PEZI|nr:P-loop containing nucleoside triphosphate hydrolase protein [Achaetomium macrosporum]
MSDDAIEAAFGRVGLWGRACGGTGACLNTELVASEWSQGEMQLLALARALLVPSKILVLDEAASSVDDKTETIMQGVIDTEWRQRTAISVLHRFAHIRQFDRVAVLSWGRLVECDTPQALLGRQSAFRELYHAFNAG